MSRTRELVILALFLVQISSCEGGRRLLPQKGTSKDSVLNPFVVPTTRKEAPTGNAPIGVSRNKAVTNCFPQVGGNQTSEAPGVVLTPL